MGQKTHPYGFRLGIVKQWRSRYYARRDFPELLKEDELIRKYLKTRLSHAAIADVHVERKPGKVTVANTAELESVRVSVTTLDARITNLVTASRLRGVRP